MSALFAQCHISEKESVWLPQIQHLGEPLTVEKKPLPRSLQSWLECSPGGNNLHPSSLAPRPSLVVIGKKKMKKNEDDGVVVAAGKNVK